MSKFNEVFVISRERPKLALYLRLKIVKGGPLELRNSSWLQNEKLKGGPLGDFKTLIMLQNSYSLNYAHSLCRHYALIGQRGCLCSILLPACNRGV